MVDLSALPEQTKSYEQRQHFMTIGNFRHAPNWDAVLYLQKTPALKSPGVFLQLQVVICLTLRQLNGKNGSAHEVQNTWR